MNKVIYFLIAFSLNAWAATELEVKEALVTQNCFAKLKFELAEYKNIPKYYLKTEGEKRPLDDIYKELQSLEADYFKTLKNWRASYNKEAKDLNELGTLISSLEGENPFVEKLRTILKSEENLLRLVHLHELIAKERKLALNKGGENCSANQEVTKELKTQLKDFSHRLEEIKTTLIRSQNKRSLLLDTSKKAIVLELKTKYAQKAQLDLGDLAKKLSSLKLAMNLNDEMDRYYRTLAQEKNSYSTLLNMYLQYEAPLKIMRGALAKGEEYQNRISELSLTPDAKAVLEKNLNQYQNTINAIFKLTLAKGPEEQLRRQKAAVVRYKDFANQLASNCLSTITDYEKLPSDRAYALIVDTCKKGAK